MSEVSTQTHWVRSSRGVISGICKALADRFGIEVWLVRAIWICSVLFFGCGILLYLILTICIPRDDRWERAQSKMILGVCARLARRGDMEVGISRLLTVMLFLFSGGIALVAYVAMYFVLPEPNGSARETQSLL